MQLTLRSSAAAALLALLVGCNGAPKGSTAASETPHPPLVVVQRFIVELTPTQTQSDLEKTARQELGGTVLIEPLFPTAAAADDPYGLRQMYRVTTDRPATDDNPWDTAYRLRDRGAFANVEPDTDTALQDVEQTAAVSACLGNQGIPAPEDVSWSLRDMQVGEAWSLPPPTGGKSQGEGVRICHPDTGWTHHVDLDERQIDLTSALDLIDGTSNALDPLGYRGNPGHGTATGSVLISSGGLGSTVGTTPPGSITGVSPRATLVPIRAVKSVVQIFDSDVARAVRHSVDAHCDVVSMSLGGRAFFGLERAIKDAVHHDVVVVTAAGNCVGFVVAPAIYSESIAVAATNAQRKPWTGSSHGRVVAIAAPGEDVYVADAESGAGEHHKIRAANGTSFATAEVAAAAADWIAYHGPEAIRNAQGQRTRRDLFVALMQASVTHPQDWHPSQYGPGVLNVAGLLRQPLSSAAASAIQVPSDDTISLLARMFDRDPAVVRETVDRLLATDSAQGVPRERFGPEVLYLATRDPAGFLSLLDAPRTATPAATTARAAAVNRFTVHGSAALRGALAQPTGGN